MLKGSTYTGQKQSLIHKSTPIVGIGRIAQLYSNDKVTQQIEMSLFFKAQYPVSLFFVQIKN